MPVLFSIEIITLNSTTNPPIITTVLIDDIMLDCKILPKLDSLGGIFFSLSINFEFCAGLLELYFQNLKSMPIVILDKR